MSAAFGKLASGKLAFGLMTAGVAAALSLGGCSSAPPPGGSMPPVAEPSPRPGDRPVSPMEHPSDPIVALVQKMLNERGYDPGPTDGLMGPRTQAAIRHYQAEHGLAADGRISLALREHLVSGILGEPARAAGARLRGDVRPSYEVGDSYIYSDGRVETVALVDGERVVWRTARGVHYSAYKNFILPVSSWDPAGVGVPRTVNVAPDVLWPLTVGEDVSFTVRRPPVARDAGSGPAEAWRCRVAGTQTVAVPAGTFDTFRVVCDRAPIAGRPDLRYVWHYAPSIRHYVRRDEIRDGSELEQRVELVAIRLGGGDWPPAARAGLHWARDDALENKADGASLEWRSSGVDATITITPVASFHNDAGARCRTFEMVRARAGAERLYPGVACRDAESGRWRIPGFDAAPASGAAGVARAGE